MSTAAFASLTGQLDGWARTRDLSAGVLLTRRGETLYEHSCGYADRASATPVSSARSEEHTSNSSH